MSGYEKHVCGILQNEFDTDEWIDPIKRVLTFDDPYGDQAKTYYRSLYQDFLNNRQESLMGIESGLSEQDLKNPDIFYNLPKEYMRIAHKADNSRVRTTYVKGKECSQCSLNKICDALEDTYARFIGTGELKAVPGEPTDDPMIFRRGYLSEWR